MLAYGLCCGAGLPEKDVPRGTIPGNLPGSLGVALHRIIFADSPRRYFILPISACFTPFYQPGALGVDLLSLDAGLECGLNLEPTEGHDSKRHHLSSRASPICIFC